MKRVIAFALIITFMAAGAAFAVPKKKAPAKEIHEILSRTGKKLVLETWKYGGNGPRWRVIFPESEFYKGAGAYKHFSGESEILDMKWSEAATTVELYVQGSLEEKWKITISFDYGDTGKWNSLVGLLDPEGGLAGTMDLRDLFTDGSASFMMNPHKTSDRNFLYADMDYDPESLVNYVPYLFLLLPLLVFVGFLNFIVSFLLTSRRLEVERGKKALFAERVGGKFNTIPVGGEPAIFSRPFARLSLYDDFIVILLNAPRGLILFWRRSREAIVLRYDEITAVTGSAEAFPGGRGKTFQNDSMAIQISHRRDGFSNPVVLWSKNPEKTLEAMRGQWQKARPAAAEKPANKKKK